jgi:RIO-like serine/threonine protein kinase
MDSEFPPISRLDRDTLSSAVAGYIKRGAWNKADVLLVVARQGRYVVKDYRRKIWLVRAAGAVQLDREERAYRALAGLRGIPRLGRRIDRDAIAVEYVEGLRLPKFHKYRPLPDLAPRLEGLLDAIHRRGVIHNDIRSRDNILVTPSGTLFLIDFSSATTFRPKGFRRWLLMRSLANAERRAFLKWKSILSPDSMSESEWARHRRFGLLRRLWPFNPKRDLRVKQARAARRGTR